MKKMKKAVTLLLSGLMVVSLGACGKGENTAPEITGVMDQGIEAGAEFDALEGVKASDKEDGDITSKITVEATPELTFKNGKTIPEKAGSYELTYTVKDKDGETSFAYSTLTVAKETSDAVLYREFDFTKEQTVDAKGWNASIAEGVDATGELKQGSFVFTINNPGTGDGDIKLNLAGFAVKPADYKLKVWAKSTANTYAHIIARDESAEDWVAYGGVFNMAIGQEIAPIELNFTVEQEGTAELMINMGKITPNPDNPSDTTPENFVVTIDKIELYEITGEETNTPVYTNDFAQATNDTVVVTAGDGAAASVLAKDGASMITIETYPSEGGVWSIKSDIALPDIKIEEGKKYYYSFQLNAENAQGGECLVESASKFDAERVSFNSFAAEAGTETVISGVFTADKGIEDPVIRLQIGSPSEGVSSNTISIDDVEFGLVEGDRSIVKTIYAFTPFGPNTANATNNEFPWQTYNGTDEDNDRGVGTIWTENGSLFYRIDNGGVTDWHNKLICGYGDNPLTLEADSYYTVAITAKATKDVSCGFFLNPLGGWDPRISQSMDITTEEQTFTFDTTDPFVTDMNFEMLFQFGSDATSQLGEVTIEITDVKIYQKKVM